MPDDKHESQPAREHGKGFDARNLDDDDLVAVSVDDEGVEYDDEIEDEDLEDEGFDEPDFDEGRVWNVSSDEDDDDEDAVEREARLGNRITRDDGDNDDLGELK